MEQATVAIIGAGPAGTTCGLLLRKKNINCVLIDRATFPRDKICGGGLTPRSYKLLSRLFPDFRYDYNSVHRLKLCIEGEQVLDFQMGEEIRIVKRRKFDAQLLERYQQQGGTFINEALTGIEEQGRKVIITLQSGRQIECEYLVGADGANSRVRKYLNPNSKHGILCMVQGFGDYMTTPQMFRKVLRDMGCPDEKPLGAYIPQSIEYPLRKNIILIGDAGGFPNRLTFEGLYYAFLTANHAAMAISTSTPFALVNKQVFSNKKIEEYAARFFYSEIGLSILKFFCKTMPGIITWAFNKAMG